MRDMKLLRPDIPWIGDHQIADDEVVVAATREELGVLAGAINEAIEAVDDWEFQTRLGVTSDEARELRSRLGELLREAFRPE